MRLVKAGFGLGAVLLAAVAVSSASGGALSYGGAAQAQGTLTSPAGQPRVTAPGGLRRTTRRHKVRRHK
jgi:hypothetical protein